VVNATADNSGIPLLRGVGGVETQDLGPALGGGATVTEGEATQYVHKNYSTQTLKHPSNSSRYYTNI
jgi:hypothetical protein